MQRLGALAQTISQQSQNISTPTTPPKAQPASPGKPLGGRGLPITTASIPAALAEAEPFATDKLLQAWLTSLIGSKPSPVWADRMTGAEWDGELTGYRLPAMTEDERAKATAMVAKSLTPMIASECFGLLGEMKLLTKCRPEQAHDRVAQLRLNA